MKTFRLWSHSSSSSSSSSSSNSLMKPMEVNFASDVETPRRGISETGHRPVSTEVKK